MTWTYTERLVHDLFWEVLENGRPLLLVYRASLRQRDEWSRFVYNGPYIGSEVRLDPFQLLVAECDPNVEDVSDPGPLPVFVYQEEELSEVKAGDTVTFKSGSSVVSRLPSSTALHEADGLDHDEWVVVVREIDAFLGYKVVKEVLLVKLPHGVVGVHAESSA